MKYYKVSISDLAEIALNKQFDYIAKEQNAPIAATHWLNGIIKSINSLAIFPKRHPVALKNSYDEKHLKAAIRYFIYKKSFRVLFTIAKYDVTVVDVNHAARFN